jgi:hypothetical protein
MNGKLFAKSLLVALLIAGFSAQSALFFSV